MGGRERARQMRRDGPRLTESQREAAERVQALLAGLAAEGREGAFRARAGQGVARESSDDAGEPARGEEALWS